MKLTNLVQRAITAVISGTVTVAQSAAVWLMRDTWTPSLQAEETANDSDKTFTVPASTQWIPQTIWIEFTTTATVGNRQIEIQFLDGASDVIGALQVGIVQAASLTYNYYFSMTSPDFMSLRDSVYMQTNLPAVTLPAGYQIRIWDNNAVAAAADDLVVQMMVLARAV